MLLLATWTLAAALLPVSQEESLTPGPWSAWLEAGENRIPFELAVSDELPRSFALVNGSESIPITRSTYEGGTWTLQLDPYDSRLVARVTEDGRGLAGEWIRYRGVGKETRMPFGARVGKATRFPIPGDARPSASAFAGRWAVTFTHTAPDGKETESPAVSHFQAIDESRIAGTFLTPLGDYRYLAGNAYNGELRLSCFDGAHAFLFAARLDEKGRLHGDFWSRNSWHETWEAVRDEDARLPDDFGLSTWQTDVSLGSLRFPDLDGNERALDEAAFTGPARLIVLFGSWCPNCGDATDYLRELRERYGERGLKVQGLAFEFGDDFERNATVLRRYARHKHIDYPILIAGTSDKAEASRAFPALDRVRAYPTTVFLDGENRVRAVHTGFSGPATGEVHTRLRERFEELVEGLLREGGN